MPSVVPDRPERVSLYALSSEALPGSARKVGAGDPFMGGVGPQLSASIPVGPATSSYRLRSDKYLVVGAAK